MTLTLPAVEVPELFLLPICVVPVPLPVKSAKPPPPPMDWATRAGQELAEVVIWSPVLSTETSAAAALMLPLLP